MSKVCAENVQSQYQESVNTFELPNETIPRSRRKPKRVLHFSDGTLEEFSSDDEVDSSTSPISGQILVADTVHLSWLPWFWYQSIFIGSKALAVCDYLGETLANFFGIISPKYEYEIEQYKRKIAEEEARRRQDAELGSLNNATLSNQLPIKTEPLRF